MSNKRQRAILIRLFVFSCLFVAIQTAPAFGQSIGSNTVFNFINLSPSAKTTALGGMNISQLEGDLGMSVNQPAFLNKEMDRQLHLSIKPYLASINQYNFNGANYIRTANTTIGWGVQYMDYGTIPMTDIAGNELGSFRPNEYSFQLSAATTYKTNFQVGATLKYIQSKYGIYHSNALATDVGIIYTPYSGLTQWALLVNNVGVQITPFNKKENLPFNITAGFSKRLASAPFQFSLTAQRLTKWDITYNDTLYNNIEGVNSASKNQNLFNHLIFGTEIYLGSAVSIQMGYNFLRRYDLNLQNQKNSLNGFSAGCSFLINNLQVQYASAFFQNNLNHHFTILYQLNKKP